MESRKKILIIQTAFLGDVILALPMVQTLKNLLPDSEIDFLCIPNTANVLENNPQVNKILKFDKKAKDKLDKLFNAISDIRENHYDIVLCPHRSFRSAVITYYSGAHIKIGFDKNSMSYLLTCKVSYDSTAHEIQRNLDLISAIPGLDLDETKIADKPGLFPAEKDIKLVEALLKSAPDGKNVTFAPCSKWYTKQLTIEKSLEIIKELFSKGFKVTLIGGAEDFEYCRKLEKELENQNEKSSLINLCGRLSPVQSAAAIGKSAALITVDSAAQHLGASTDTPIVLIYGSTNSSFGFYPLTSNHIIIENKELQCRPCTDHGRTECPLGHFKCIKDLSAEEIVSSVNKLVVENKK